MTEQATPAAVEADTTRAEDEPLPFLSNFQDIFLSVGIIIFLVGISILTGSIGVRLADGAGSPFFVMAAISGAVLAVVWALSEVIVRRRRRILPGIILCIAFMGLSFSILTNVYTGIVGEDVMERLDDAEWVGPQEFPEGEEITHESLRWATNTVRDALPAPVRFFIIIAPLFMLGAAFVYYRRFRLPFASATVGAAAVGLLFCEAFYLSPYDTIRFLPTVIFLSGLLLLIAGVLYDMRDPQRVTRWSGNGFWLHFFAAPLVLTGALTIAAQGFAFDFPAMEGNNIDFFAKRFSPRQSVITLIVIAVFAVISLLLNRRALLVAGLLSAGIAIGVIVKAIGLGGAEVAAVTLIVLGGGILLLGLGWHTARMALLTFVPNSGVWRRVFPRETIDG